MSNIDFQKLSSTTIQPGPYTIIKGHLIKFLLCLEKAITPWASMNKDGFDEANYNLFPPIKFNGQKNCRSHIWKSNMLLKMEREMYYIEKRIWCNRY